MQTHTSQGNRGAAIDQLSERDAMSAMLTSHIAALEAARSAIADISAASALVARTVAAGGTVHYAAAGSSGLMALADACELPGTFQISPGQIRIHMAGGVPAEGVMSGSTEDDREDAARAASAVDQNDVAIVVSASGTTPYALAFAEAACTRGVSVIGIANTANSALLAASDVAISLNTAPEVVEGSTRLAAGTAQKAVLNMISTQVGVLLGHVHDGLMINLNPDNIKLRQRASDIVSRIACVAADDADEALRMTGYNAKLATLVAAGAGLSEAKALLTQNRGHLRACLRDIAPRTKPNT
ncbi:N-acetylmuramic acid 6-phosphate etherase [uncultured Roseobacter sp.]|uniref:N-acetylmuramic acid 6-phosphate etherase n=1 Tax=uncultured Roseobacter sp. TaxID=114847 RepID=UPI00262306F6|nr:N-acetylmuramic acid 6-phosphate etherase [uncultured Roseobacter sp.]